MITVTNLYKSFPMGGETLTAPKGVNLQIKRGELIAIVGASGAGKSTLLHIIGTLDRPTTGTVHFEGQDMFHMSEGDRQTFGTGVSGLSSSFIISCRSSPRWRMPVCRL